MPLGTSSAFAICNIPNLYTNFRCNFFDKNEIEPPYMVALLLCALWILNDAVKYVPNDVRTSVHINFAIIMQIATTTPFIAAPVNNQDKINPQQ